MLIGRQWRPARGGEQWRPGHDRQLRYFRLVGSLSGSRWQLFNGGGYAPPINPVARHHVQHHRDRQRPVTVTTTSLSGCHGIYYRPHHLDHAAAAPTGPPPTLCLAVHPDALRQLQYRRHRHDLCRRRGLQQLADHCRHDKHQAAIGPPTRSRSTALRRGTLTIGATDPDAGLGRPLVHRVQQLHHQRRQPRFGAGLTEYRRLYRRQLSPN